MRNPEDLAVYRLSLEVADEIYDAVSGFPDQERYGLTSQMSRAAVSVFSNLAEGCSRSSQRDFARFVEMSLGSAMELRAQLRFASKRGWMGSLEEAEKAQRRVEKLVQSIIRFQKGLV